MSSQPPSSWDLPGATPPAGPPSGPPGGPPAGPPAGPPQSPYPEPWNQPTAQPLGSMPPGYPQYPPVGYGQRRRSPWKWVAWGCGGCAVLIVIGIVISVILGTRIVSSRPLAHFPVPAGSHQTLLNLHAGPQGSNLLSDDENWNTGESTDQVVTFYETALGQGWVVDSGAGSQTITFHRAGKSGESGTLSILAAQSGGTDIVVKYDYPVFG